MFCPQCREPETMRVKDTRYEENGAFLKRYRWCDHCKKWWTTVEFLVGEHARGEWTTRQLDKFCLERVYKLLHKTGVL